MSGAHTGSTRGVVFIHCCPPAIGPHVEWALAGVLGRPCKLAWTAQPASPGQLRAEATWVGPIGMAARLSASPAGLADAAVRDHRGRHRHHRR